MVIYKAKLDFNRDSNQLEKLLTNRLLKPDYSPFYIFPFCLFKKSFYQDWKDSRKGLFKGEIENGLFNLSLTSKVFSTRTRFPLTISGFIKNGTVKIDYKIPNYMIFVVVSLLITDLIFIKPNSGLDNIFYLMGGLIIFEYFLQIIRIRNVINGLFID
jgi:hypothetical protein